jgi:hypothetical protein
MSTRREKKVFWIQILVTPEAALLTKRKSSTEKVNKQLSVEINNYVKKL